jgi:hypothetical protein
MRSNKEEEEEKGGGSNKSPSITTERWKPVLSEPNCRFRYCRDLKQSCLVE